MFDQYTKKEENVEDILAERLKMLPPIVQKVFLESNWPEKLKVIAKENNLRVDQVTVLEDQTLMIMLALVTTEEFIKNLQTEGEIPKDLAIKLTNEINTRIIHDIKEHLVSFKSDEDKANEDTTTDDQKYHLEIKKDLPKEPVSFAKNSTKESVTFDPYKEPIE